MRDNPFFDPLSTGRWSPSQISVQSVQNTQSRSPESEAFIEQRWQERLGAGFKAWPNDTKPGRWRLANFTADHSQVKLMLDPCVSYKDHSGATAAEFRTRFGRDYLPNALAVTVFVTAKSEHGDEYFLVTHRSEKADYKPRGLHYSIGGFIEIKKEPTGDLVAAAYRELKEETGIEKWEVRLIFLGFVFDPLQNKPEAIFSGEILTLLETVRGRVHDDENELLWVPFYRLPVWLIETAPVTVGPGVAAALLGGGERFGEEWVDYHLRNLALSWRTYGDPHNHPQLETIGMRNLDQLVKQLP